MRWSYAGVCGGREWFFEGGGRWRRKEEERADQGQYSKSSDSPLLSPRWRRRAHSRERRTEFGEQREKGGREEEEETSQPPSEEASEGARETYTCRRPYLACATVDIQERKVSFDLEYRGEHRVTHMIPRPRLSSQPNFLSKLIVSMLAIRSSTEEGHRVVQIRVIDLNGHVAARGKGRSARARREDSNDEERAYCTQGCTRSPYHSGKRVDLKTQAFIDMRRWKRPDHPLPSTSASEITVSRDR